MTVYADLVRYRELFSNLFRRDFQAKYKGSLLGVLWSLLNPLILLGVYLLVFGVIFPSPQIPHYALYLLAGPRVLDLLRDVDAVGRALARRLGRPRQEGALPAPARRVLDGRDAGGHLRGDGGDPDRALADLRRRRARRRCGSRSRSRCCSRPRSQGSRSSSRA